MIYKNVKEYVLKLRYHELPMISLCDIKYISISFEGFDDTESPEYRSGRSLVTKVVCDDRFKPVFKCGANTGITRGTLKVYGASVRMSDLPISLTYSQRKEVYRVTQQYEVVPWGPTFADFGDSGSLVFMLKDKDELVCIGMVIGGTIVHTTIVTPIEDVLAAFDIRCSKLHAFTNDAMDV